MEENFSVYKNTKVRFFQKGKNPVWLLYSGTHGDEFGVIHSIQSFIDKYENLFPDFLWVPEVSPSAIAQKTREDSQGLDTNRIFFESSTNEEVLANFQIVKDKQFDYFLDFHEDPAVEEFYVYDSLGKRDKIINYLLQVEQQSGFSLLNGVDDVKDPALGFPVINGYVDDSFRKKNSGFTGDYLLNHGIVKNRAWTFEIPGHVSQQEKDTITENIFKTYLKFLNV